MRIGCWIIFIVSLAVPFLCAQAGNLTEARVSQVIRDVKLLPKNSAARPAEISDEVKDGAAVRTGVESRAELTFTDETLARLGANTIFTFNEGTRDLELGGGAMLLQVPKTAGGAKIKTAVVTAAITGTTIMLEYHAKAFIKYIILEGTGRIFRNDRAGESVLLHAGQMIIINPTGKGLPEPVDVDIARLKKTSALLTGKFKPLPSLNLIADEIKTQEQLKAQNELLDTNLVIFGGGTAGHASQYHRSAGRCEPDGKDRRSPEPDSDCHANRHPDSHPHAHTDGDSDQYSNADGLAHS